MCWVQAIEDKYSQLGSAVRAGCRKANGDKSRSGDLLAFIVAVDRYTCCYLVRISRATIAMQRVRIYYAGYPVS